MNSSGIRHTFTIFTPTFNRAHTLPRVYESLRAQTFTDFEWIVVDDGSTDGTEELVRAWIEDAPFSLRYFYQENSGKHVVHNLASQEAAGRFDATVDSDDWYVPTALETFIETWNSIDKEIRDCFVGVVGLCVDPSGGLIGSRLPEDPLDTTYTELRTRYGVTGDKAGFARTDVVQRFPHPVIPGEKLWIEAVVYHRISREYLVRCINEVIQIRDYQPDGDSLGVRTAAATWINNPRTSKLLFLEQIRHEAPARERLRRYANHTRYAAFGGFRLFGQSLHDAPSKAWWVFTLPVAAGLCLRDLHRRFRDQRLSR